MLIITDWGEKSLASFFCKRLMGGMDKLVCPYKKRQCKVRKKFSGASMIRVMRIYESALLLSKKGDTDKQVCPCHPLPIASPKSVIIRIIVIYETILLSEMWHKCPFYKP